MKLLAALDIDPRYLRYLWPYAPLIGLTLLTMAGSAALSVVMPWPLKYIVDHVIGGQPFTDPFGQAFAGLLGNDAHMLAAGFGALMVLIAVFAGLFSFAQAYLQGIVQLRTIFRLRSDAFAHIQALSLRFHDRSCTGELISRVNSDAERVMETLVSSCGDLLVNLFRLLSISAVMFWVNWRLAFVALVYVPLLLLLLQTLRHHIKSAARTARAEEGQMLSVSFETITSIRAVQAFGRETTEQQRFDQHGTARMVAELHTRRWEALFSPIVDIFKAVGTAAIVWFGVTQIAANQLTVGEMLIFLSYLATFYEPLQKFSKLASALQKAAVSGARIAELLDEDTVIRDTPNARDLKQATGEITFEKVNFGYENDRVVLCNVTFNALPGQTIGLVGHTGAGKSTIANLLLRFYDVSKGHILLDGIDIRKIRLHDLRQQIALVTQEPILFASSIRDNIAYGRPDASMNAIIAAARAANAHEFISDLPDGYDTVIGERGATLSGGQRQRIAIARAILCDAPILILDEPTAALDAKAEHEVMTALEQLMKGRTTLIIAHRLATIRHADTILVFRNGKIVERGRHDTLVRRNGHYAELVRLQSGEPLPDADVVRNNAPVNKKVGNSASVPNVRKPMKSRSAEKRSRKVHQYVPAGEFR
jgi:subfamily B ATP-binding cassette protein MsbA